MNSSLNKKLIYNLFKPAKFRKKLFVTFFFRRKRFLPISSIHVTLTCVLWYTMYFFFVTFSDSHQWKPRDLTFFWSKMFRFFVSHLWEPICRFDLLRDKEISWMKLLPKEDSLSSRTTQFQFLPLLFFIWSVSFLLFHSITMFLLCPSFSTL